MCSPAFHRHVIYVDFAIGLVILHRSFPGLQENQNTEAYKPWFAGLVDQKTDLETGMLRAVLSFFSLQN